MQPSRSSSISTARSSCCRAPPTSGKDLRRSWYRPSLKCSGSTYPAFASSPATARWCRRTTDPIPRALTVEGQVQGSVWMGMGQAMSEETGYHEGLLVTGNMLDYRVPTIQDSPPIEVGIVESNDPHGPFGAKEAGEGSLAAFLPALTNAVADAIGVRFNILPVTPDRVFAALEKRRRAGNGHAEKADNTGS